jgi:hypothetical protein
MSVPAGDLQAHKKELERMLTDAAKTTQTGGIHLEGGHRGWSAVSQSLHEHKLAEQAAGTSRSYCDFAKFGVVPDVVKSNPPAICAVKYRGKEVMLGQVMLVKDTQTPPELDWPQASVSSIAGVPQMYTVIMVDPDAPSPQKPIFRHWCHWVVCNVPGPHNLEQGYTVCPYMGPAPPPNTGLHRYVFLIYAQKGVIESNALHKMSDAERKSWSLDNFLAQHKYAIDGSIPIAGNMFRCQNEH